jgi:4-hydroxy-tetrahydrodipicolinate synthase
MGERPAVAHLRAHSLPGFTTGSGCLAPGLCNAILGACVEGDWARAESLRAAFLPLEDQRDAWGPARVLHAAIELAGVAATGPIPPFVSPIAAGRRAELEPTARALLARERERPGAAVPGPRR